MFAKRKEVTDKDSIRFRINKYAYDFSSHALTASETFAQGFTDTPERPIAAPWGAPSKADPGISGSVFVLDRRSACAILRSILIVPHSRRCYAQIRRHAGDGIRIA
jgi:hypothetical protein